MLKVLVRARISIALQFNEFTQASMRLLLSFLCTIFFCGSLYAQVIQVDANTFTSQQLIEDVLINSGCIQNIQITNEVTGNFGGQEKSFGYFNNAGSSFPFQEGIVMSTGRLSNVPGPNNSLSDDDAPGWVGDPDLELALQINNTINATILEFDFVPTAENIRFRYIFASEEYQEGNGNTCRFSDAFAFLIRPQGGNYTNIAVVPGTQTPVQVTTVHSGIPGSCDPINEEFFEGWNGSNVPINFNGQTKILSAEAAVIPNQTYHIKLVIADEKNFRFDSAVFLEAESFSISADLGEDQSFQNNNPLCENEVYTLDATPINSTAVGYAWYQDGVLLPTETGDQLIVTSPGVYSVEVDLGNGCVAPDEVLIEYTGPVVVQDTSLFQCEPSNTGFATYNLFDAETAVVDGDQTLQIESFHLSIFDAENGIDPIPNPTQYENIQPTQILHARVVSIFDCVGVADITLRTTTTMFGPYDLTRCSSEDNSGIATFNLSEALEALTEDAGSGFNITFHETYADAQALENVLPLNYTNSQSAFQTIYARLTSETGCAGTAEINLFVVPTPQFTTQEYQYCLGMIPETMTIDSGVIGGSNNFEFAWSSGATTPTIEITSPGSYTVQVTRETQLNGQTYRCTGTNTIVVSGSEIATITYVLEGNFGNQDLIVTANGIGEYVYALDAMDGPFQVSPIFQNVAGGKHTIYVKDLNGCGTASAVAYVLEFPQFFTPNEDGFNDTWFVKGIDKDNLQINRTVIFDRFGKILFVIGSGQNAWDGMYNGNLMPASDYWFQTTFTDGGSYRGHFTLKR